MRLADTTAIVTGGRAARRWMLFHEPPTHTRLRHPLHRSSTPRAVGRLEERVRGIADRFVDDLPASGGGDLVERFSHPLPAAVIRSPAAVPAASDPVGQNADSTTRR